MGTLKLGSKELPHHSYYGVNGKGGMMLNYKFVKQLYLGSTLIWEDENVPTLKTLNEDAPYWSAQKKRLQTEIFNYSETNPIPVEGVETDYFNIEYFRCITAEYSNGEKYFFTTESANKTWYIGKAYLNDSLLENTLLSTNYFTKVTFPKLTSAYPKTWIFKRTTLNNESEEYIQYQTSDEHALFGLSSDSYKDLDFGSTAKDWLTRSDEKYLVTVSSGEAKALIFRPLKECQLNFELPDGYYCEVKNCTTGSELMLKIHNIITNTATGGKLPSSTEDLNDTSNYPKDTFKQLQSSLNLTPETFVLVGLFTSGTFDFSNKFYLDKTTITVNGDTGSYGTIKINAADDVTWKAESDVIWLQLDKTSGTGTSTITINPGRNTTGSKRTGHITVTDTSSNKSLTVDVIQNVYVAPTLSFTNTPAPWTVSAVTGETDTWWISDNNDTTGGTSFIPFVPSKSGNVTLETDASVSSETCDPTVFGTTVSTNGTTYAPLDAIAFCSDIKSQTYAVTANTTYYVQIKKPSGSSISFLTISFK